MSLTRRALRNLLGPPGLPSRLGRFGIGGGLDLGGSFESFSRNGYAGNAIIYAGINLISTSAAEPHIVGKRYRRNRRVTAGNSIDARYNSASGVWDASPVTLSQAKHQTKVADRYLASLGIGNHAGSRRRDALLVHNGFYEEVDNHPLVQLLNNPNPFASRGQLWGMAALDYHLAGNAYLLKARYDSGMLRGAVGELWRLRPDRVRVIPDSERFIAGYEYGFGSEKVTYDARDVMHFKTLNPLDMYYGMPPLMAVNGRIAIDNYMQTFLADFFQKGGTGPGAIFSTKGKLTQEDKDDARDRFSRMFGPGHFTEMLLLDNAEGFTYTPLSLNRGLRDALPKEIDAQTEARLAMVLNVPGAILGLLIGYETSSYANQRQAWQVLWDVKMTPLLSDFDDVLNLSLVPEFAGVDEVAFDLSDIRALQEDEDKMQDRHRKNFTAGGIGLKEFRLRIGEDPELPADDVFFLPSSSVATKAGEVGEMPEAPEEPAALIAQGVKMLAARAGRPRTEDDPGARAIWDKAEDLRAGGMTFAAIANEVGVTVRTLRRYRAVFEDDE